MAIEGINGKETMEANGRVTMEVINEKNVKNEKETQVSMEVNIKDINIDKASEINYRGWKAMPFIIGNETFEKLGALGTLANLLIYLTSVFNMKSITAATFLSVFNGTCNMATLIGAFLSDTYFGRFKTVGFAIVVSFLGLLAIDLTASIPSLHPPHCGLESSSCKEATSSQLAVLYSGFALMIIGAGGIRPCNLAFGADQFNPTTESGKRGIASFFNWYNFSFTFAQLVAVTLIVYIQSNVSWAIGLGIPPALMLVSCALFYMGSKIYVKVKATGSPMASVVQVIVVAIKKRRLKHLEQPWISLFNFTPPGSINSKLSYTDQFRFLDKAAIRTPEDQTNLDGSPANPWKLCSLQQVEEVKCIMRILPIWVAAVVYYLVTNTQNTYPVFQANQSDRRLGNSSFHIPAASYSVFLMLGFTIFIPIYDRILVPFLRRVTGKEQGITVLQRIGIGIVFTILAMVVSGIVEDQRRTIALTRKTIGVVPRKGAISSMSALWLVPQLFLAGISEGLGSVGLMEFYYRQFPENMRSIAGSLFYLGLAGSSYLSSLLITIVHHRTRGSSTGDWLAEDLNKGRLDYYYYMIAGMEIIVFVYFLICAKWYRYKEAMSHIPEENGGLTNSDKGLA